MSAVLEKVEEERRGGTHVSSFHKILDKKPKRVAVFSHNCPDPDALGSMMAIQWLLEKLGIESELFYGGHISHPQNLAVVNLLNPVLHPAEDYHASEYDANILVDTVPANAGTAGHVIDFDLVIDHHKEIPNGGFKGVFINLKAGSCCGTVYSIIEGANFKFRDDNDADSKVATALMVGIATDTENLMSDDTTEYEFKSFIKLWPHRDTGALKQIINFQRPKIWTERKAEAAKNVTINNGVSVVGLGIINGQHRDMIADMAAEMISWEDVNTAIVFALVDGAQVEGSVRSRNASISVPQLCKELGGRCGSGGGKLGKGAYRYDLGGGSLEEDDDDETRQLVWDGLKAKEIKRIFRAVRNDK